MWFVHGRARYSPRMLRRALNREYSLEDYWMIEDASRERFEFWQGDVLAMAGGSTRHNHIGANVIATLVSRLRGRPCRVLSGDQRIRTPDGLYSYADASVFCGDVHMTGDPRPTADNPTVLVEVLSPSTRAYDRGDKRELYLAIPSLRDLLLVEQDRAVVEHWRRGEDRFEQAVIRGSGGVVRLQGCVVELPLSEIYEGVGLDA